MCSEQMAVMSFKHGLRPKSKLRQSLTKRPAIALKDLCARIEQYARLEDDQIPIEVASAEQTARHKTRTDQGEHRGLMVNEVDKSKSHEVVVTVFKEPIYRILEKIKREPFFVWPPKMLGYSTRRNQKLRCTYHQDKGHMTQNCKALKQHLEDLVAAGHLWDYIDQDKEVTEPGNPPQEPNIEHPPWLIINVIHGTTTQEPEEALKEEFAKAVQIQQVMSVEPASKKVRSATKPPLSTVSFTRKDLEGIQYLHTDALIITVEIGKRFDVKRVLVDQGSAVDILYYDLFRKLGLSKQHLTPAVAPLVGFNSQPEWPLGKIVLPVVAGTKTLQIEFLVINTPSPYNAILGHLWIYQMEAVPSTYHQLICFSTKHGVEQISEDQVASKHCFMAALKAKQLCNWIQTVEVAEQPVLEDVGGAPEEKMVEDLEKVLVKEHDPEKYFLIGTSLGADEKLQLLELLRENMEAFTWSAYDTPRLSPKFACHKLNINPSARPVVQKSQRSSVEHTEVVIAGVKKLLASGAIREVQYP
ncbi:uncharacterized protein LOC114278338 [Camellia sinensis]|uniref:uncharacterized protein LOC114278338 n=1 Tax=Camellia sinensis TaxID=4442 RepID=UPI0010358D02|nr:uncharacterized protein LOC114278338 [Camellia sinensis]